MEFRRLHPGDDALVKRHADEVFDEPVRHERLAAYLASPDHFMIDAIADGIVVGHRMTPKIGTDFREDHAQNLTSYSVLCASGGRAAR